ncbi:MAG: hypothetical protein IJ231_07410 [Clostridia bacterium]|nr:hypothetical protein [Clostridia bacterium]
MIIHTYGEKNAPVIIMPLFLVQAPFNISGAGNIAGAVMYLGLFILYLI